MVYEDGDSQPKVSVIMPVHNTGCYLGEALDCLRNQTFDNFEIICVDDGSDDLETIEILQKYEQWAWNFQVIRLQECVGAGEARNIGFQRALGEYVIFLDSDDLFEPDLLKEMYERIEDAGADVCICASDSFCRMGDSRNVKTPNLEAFQRKDEGWLSKFSTATWDKLIRREYIKKGNFYFQDIKGCNDAFFIYMILLYAYKLAITEKVLVHYREVRQGKITDGRNPSCICEAVNKTLSVIKEKKLRVEVTINLMMHGPLEISICKEEDLRRDAYKTIKHILKENLNKNDLRNPFFICMYEELLANEYDKEKIDVFYFYCCYKFQWERIEEKMIPSSRIGVWGIGKRGRAFILLCEEKNVLLFGITDSVYEYALQCGTIYRRVNDKVFLDKVQVAIAGNHEVSDMLKGKGMQVSLDLEDFG